MLALKTRVSTGRALMIRPAQSVFFETGAVCVPDSMFEDITLAGGSAELQFFSCASQIFGEPGIHSASSLATDRCCGINSALPSVLRAASKKSERCAQFLPSKTIVLDLRRVSRFTKHLNRHHTHGPLMSKYPAFSVPFTDSNPGG